MVIRVDVTQDFRRKILSIRTDDPGAIEACLDTLNDPSLRTWLEDTNLKPVAHGYQAILKMKLGLACALRQQDASNLRAARTHLLAALLLAYKATFKKLSGQELIDKIHIALVVLLYLMADATEATLRLGKVEETSKLYGFALSVRGRIEIEQGKGGGRTLMTEAARLGIKGKVAAGTNARLLGYIKSRQRDHLPVLPLPSELRLTCDILSGL